MERFSGTLLLILALASPVIADEDPPLASPAQWMPPAAAPGFSYPDCFCTGSSGERIEKGQTACLRVGGQEFLARCGMSQNNPAWRKVQEDCGPTS